MLLSRSHFSHTSFCRVKVFLAKDQTARTVLAFWAFFRYAGGKALVELLVEDEEDTVLRDWMLPLNQ